MKTLLYSVVSVALVLKFVAPVDAQNVQPPGTVGDTTTFNIVQWSGNQLPRIYERSEELPLTDDEVIKLAQAGFAPEEVTRMIEQRRCRCDSSADGLIRMKKAGVAESTIAAVSRHGLKPNRSIDLVITLDFIGRNKTPTAGIGGRVRPAYLYFFVTDGEVVRTYMANIADVLSKNTVSLQPDQTDVLRPKPVSRVQVAGEVPLVNYGKHDVVVVASNKPNLLHTSDMSAEEQERAIKYTFDYPRSSLQRRCDLRSSYAQDVVLANRWSFEGASLTCQWN